MATERDVERTLRDLVKRFDGSGVRAGAGSDRSLVCVITDLAIAFRAEFAGGRIKGLRRIPEREDADVVVSVGSDDLIALAEGRASVPMSLLLGRLRVDAGASDMMLLRQLF